MYRFTTFSFSVVEIWAFKVEKKSADSAKIAYFRHFEGSFLAKWKSKSSKPIHIWKLHNEDLPLKKTAFKNTQMEANDVIFKMADFDLKMQISQERCIQFWQSIPFFSSSNCALFDGFIHFSKEMGEKLDVVRVPPLKSWPFTPCKRPPSKNRFYMTLGLGLSDS